MITPASPWMGSSSTAAVLSSMAASIAAASPKGTETKPGANGPKSSRATGSSLNPTIVVVRPWKFPSATMMVAASAGTPFTRYAHARATLMPVSTASAPVFIGSTRSLPHRSASAVANAPNWSLWKARLVSVTRPSCSVAAAMRAGCRCPKFSAEYAARRSRYRLPSTSVTQAPSPLLIATGSGE